MEQRNQEATIYVGSLDEKVDEELLWELFTQVGPVVSIFLPKDRITSLHQGFGFVEFRSEIDAEYASKIMNMVKLYSKPIRVNKSGMEKKGALVDVGANLFIGNLDLDVDEKSLYDTFSAFGSIMLPPKIQRDPDTGVSKGYGFICYDSFESSDIAIECMNGQFLGGKQVVVQYALKKDSTSERHGTAAERLLAAAAKSGDFSSASKVLLRPHTLFASAPGQITSTVPQNALSMQQVGSEAFRPVVPVPLPSNRLVSTPMSSLLGTSRGLVPPPPPPLPQAGSLLGGPPPPPPPPPIQG